MSNTYRFYNTQGEIISDNMTCAAAKKAEGYPSVTSILGMLHGEALEAWKRRKVVEETLFQPYDSEFMEFGDWMEKVSNAHEYKTSSEEGTIFHDSFENYNLGETCEQRHKQSILDLLGYLEKLEFQHDNFTKINLERCETNPLVGFAGTVDLSGKILNPSNYNGRTRYIGDIKTQRDKWNKHHKFWDKYILQLVAYAQLLEWPIDDTEFVTLIKYRNTERTAHCLWGRKKINSAVRQFDLMKELWFEQNFDPRPKT